MLLHTPFSLLWSVLAFSLALFVLATVREAPANRAFARFFTAMGWWAFCEFLWNNAETPEAALRWLHIGSPGFLPLGGLYLLFLLNLIGRERLAARKSVVAFAYGVPLLIGAIALTGVPLFDRVTQTSWGWGYHPTKLYLLFLAHIGICFSAGIWFNLQSLKEATSRRARRRIRLLLVASIIPIFTGTFTDAVLPLLDIQVFRIASLAATVMLGMFMYAMAVYREPLVSPETVSSEILATIPDAVFLIDQHGQLVHTNAAACLLTGWPAQKLRGMVISDLIEVPSDALRKPARGTFSSIQNAEVLLKTREGEKVPVALSSSAVIDNMGDVVGLVGIARDLRTLRQLQTQVAQSDKLAAIGRLASGIGHEINNPITYVSMNLRALHKELQDLDQPAVKGEEGRGRGWAVSPDLIGRMRELLDESMEGAARIHEIAHNMRQYSELGPGKLKRTDLRSEIMSALRIADPEIKHSAKVHLELEDLPPVMASAPELQQVLVNLLINATQAIDGYGNVWIRTLKKDGWAAVEVEDDGTGIDSDVLPLIFDPYFTTKEAGKGSGLGLSISYQILDRMGGRISVRAAKRQGSIFRLELPLAAV